MDESNAIGGLVEEELQENGFLNFSFAGNDIRGIVEKVEKLENELLALKENSETLKIQQNDGQLMMKMGVQIGEKYGKEIAELHGQNEELKNEIVELRHKNDKLKEEMAKNEKEKKNVNVPENMELKEIRNEMAKLHQENILLRAECEIKHRALEGKILDLKINYAKQTYPDKPGNKAVKKEFTNVLNRVNELGKTIESLEKLMEALIINSNALKYNKWNGNIFNWGKCSVYSADSFTLYCVDSTNKDFDAGKLHFNSVRAELPICLSNFGLLKKQRIASYFEVKMLKKSKYSNKMRVGIGFCANNFPLENIGIGGRNGSIGLYTRIGMSIDGELMRFKNSKNVNASSLHFGKGDVVGCGLIFVPAKSQWKCFASLNGDYLGSIVLPPKYATSILYPAASLYFKGESIRANFGAEDFLFNPYNQSQLLD